LLFTDSKLSLISFVAYSYFVRYGPLNSPSRQVVFLRFNDVCFFAYELKKLFLADIIKTRRNSLTEAQKGGREREG